MRSLLLAICFAACTASPSPPKSDDTRVVEGEAPLPKFDDSRVAELELVLAKIDAAQRPMIAAN